MARQAYRGELEHLRSMHVKAVDERNELRRAATRLRCDVANLRSIHDKYKRLLTSISHEAIEALRGEAMLDHLLSKDTKARAL